MKQQAIMTNMNVKAAKNTTSTSISTLLQDLIVNNRIIAWFTAMFSLILGEKVTNQQTFDLIHAQLAFAALFLSGCASFAVQVLFFLWFCITLLQCRRDFKKDKND